MKRFPSLQVASMAAAILFFFPAVKSDAIPAFARKYQISCQVCHSPVMPRLKGFGEEFAGNGFRMTDYESPRHFIPVGDNKLSLFRELPLALRMDGFVTANFNNQESVDFGSPFVLKILSGGEISDKLSYYFYFLLNERGSIAGVEDAFLMYHDLFGSGINFYIGQFQVSDPLFKGELRFTLEPYMIYSIRPGNSRADLRYDRGIILERDFPTGTTLVGEVVNGNGIGTAGEGWIFDSDKYKNFMLRINQSLGKYLTLGLFGYAGKEELPGVTVPFLNRIKMIGPDLTLNFDEKLIFNIQYLMRFDSDVFSRPGMMSEDITTNGGFAELIYAPRGDMSNWYLTWLFNYVNSDLEDLDYQSTTFHLGYIIRRNLRLVGEYTYTVSNSTYGKVSAGFISAF
jgi:hypothetical protein